MIGEKLPLLIIVKSKRPRQISTVKYLDYNYYFNPTAWMNEMVCSDDDETNDINSDVLSDELDPCVIDIKTVYEYLDCIKLYA
jgi:hypothetical protein